MITFLYLFDLFKDLLIILLRCNGFQNSGSTNPTNKKPIVDPIFMQIAIVLYHYQSRAIEFIKILRLKYFEINLNPYPEIKVFIVYGYVYIKLVYNIFIDYIMISYLKVKLIDIKSF